MINLKILLIVILFIIYNGNDVKKRILYVKSLIKITFVLTNEASFVQVDNFKNLFAS